MPKKKKVLDNDLDNQLDNAMTAEEYDAEKVQADIDDTILKAEGSFAEKNGLRKATAKKQEKAKGNKIGKAEIKNALEVLQKYNSGKANRNARVRENEQWWKLRHWETMHNEKSKFVKPTSAWLFNSLMNKLADFSDNYPEANIRARTREDVDEAERIKNVLPMIIEANDYEQTYNETCLAKIKNGTGITGVFWNADKDDIDIKPIDVLSIIWEPGVKDIQASRNVFTVELVDNDVLKELYPDADFKDGGTIISAEYINEDNVDKTDKTAVIDWYYKRDGILHYCKFANDAVLFATENEPNEYPNGLYDDGNYPFVFDTLFKMEGTIAGFGFLDVCKSPQEYIDRLDQAIINNALLCAVPRYFIRKDASVNKDEFLDWNNALVECATLAEDDVRQIVVNQLGAEIFNARDGKINELKQTSGNSDVNTGVSSQGVTAASAISQLIETGSKGSRLAIKGTYRAFRQIIYMVIERMRQFYDTPRYVRITGDDGTEQFDLYDNSGLVQQEGINELTGETTYRLPQFDIEVAAQKANPYNKMSNNELALQFYQYQFFNPQNADATLSALEMMDFDHKEDVIAKVSENGTLYGMVMQMQQQMQFIQAENNELKMAANLAYGTNIPVDGIAPQIPPVGQQSAPRVSAPSDDRTGTQAEKARQRAAQAAEV